MGYYVRNSNQCFIQREKGIIYCQKRGENLLAIRFREKAERGTLVLAKLNIEKAAGKIQQEYISPYKKL